MLKRLSTVKKIDLTQKKLRRRLICEMMCCMVEPVRNWLVPSPDGKAVDDETCVARRKGEKGLETALLKRGARVWTVQEPMPARSFYRRMSA
jgi:hypothetical protein